MSLKQFAKTLSVVGESEKQRQDLERAQNFKEAMAALDIFQENKRTEEQKRQFEASMKAQADRERAASLERDYDRQRGLLERQEERERADQAIKRQEEAQSRALAFQLAPKQIEGAVESALTLPSAASDVMTQQAREIFGRLTPEAQDYAGGFEGFISTKRGEAGQREAGKAAAAREDIKFQMGLAKTESEIRENRAQEANYRRLAAGGGGGGGGGVSVLAAQKEFKQIMDDYEETDLKIRELQDLEVSQKVGDKPVVGAKSYTNQIAGLEAKKRRLESMYDFLRQAPPPAEARSANVKQIAEQFAEAQKTGAVSNPVMMGKFMAQMIDALVADGYSPDDANAIFEDGVNEASAKTIETKTIQEQKSSAVPSQPPVGGVLGALNKTFGDLVAPGTSERFRPINPQKQPGFELPPSRFRQVNQ